MCSHKEPRLWPPQRMNNGWDHWSNTAVHYVLKYGIQRCCSCHRCLHRKLWYVFTVCKVEGAGQSAGGLSLRAHMEEKNVSNNVGASSEFWLFTCSNYFIWVCFYCCELQHRVLIFLIYLFFSLMYLHTVSENVWVRNQ